MTKPIHPRSNIIILGQKPKRTRRTKAQMATAAADAEFNALWAKAAAAAEERLKTVSPGQKRAAERTLWRWNHPRH